MRYCVVKNSPVERIHNYRQCARPQPHEDQRHDALDDGPDEEAAQPAVPDVGEARDRREREGDARAGQDPHVLGPLHVLVVRLVRDEGEDREEAEEGPRVQPLAVVSGVFGRERGRAGVVVRHGVCRCWC